MTRFKAAGIGALAIVLAAAPVASAFGSGGGRHYHGGYYVNPFYPIFGLAAAVVGTAAAIVTLPFALIGAAARAPGYYPAGAYNGAPVADAYAPAPGYGQSAYAQPGYAAPPAYYNSAPAPYYAAPQAYAPARPVYRGTYRAPGGYGPGAGYAPQYGSQYAPPPPNNGYAPPPASYPAPPSNYGQGNYRYNANPNGYAPRPVSYGPPAGSAPDHRPNN